MSNPLDLTAIAGITPEMVEGEARRAYDECERIAEQVSDERHHWDQETERERSQWRLWATERLLCSVAPLVAELEATRRDRREYQHLATALEDRVKRAERELEATRAALRNLERACARMPELTRDDPRYVWWFLILGPAQYAARALLGAADV